MTKSCGVVTDEKGRSLSLWKVYESNQILYPFGFQNFVKEFIFVTRDVNPFKKESSLHCSSRHFVSYSEGSTGSGEWSITVTETNEV